MGLRNLIFGKKKSSKKRDDAIGLIANVIDHLLREKGYDRFSSGYLVIDEGFEGAGWNGRDDYPLPAFSFKVTDIELHELLRDDVFGEQTDIGKTITVDLYCTKVHKYLKENLKDYKDAGFLDPRLS